MERIDLPKKEIWLTRAECTGCGACESACPVNALSVRLDKSGFSFPLINNDCIGCNACERVCKRRNAVHLARTETPEVYAAWSKDEEIRFKSTSGGAFTALGEAVLIRGGVVFGARYDESCNVVCAEAQDAEGLSALRQSKYVQSDMRTIFRRVRELLKEGRCVAFCGAPCQVAGLYAYLDGDKDNLVTFDFVCRGVNSPKAYRAWLDELELSQGAKAVRVWFKYKEGGWKTSPLRTRIDFSDGTHVIQDQSDNYYMRGYLGPNLYMRPSCSACEFKGLPRMGDVTLADFWGVDVDLDDDKGTSMVLVNSDKGAEVLTAGSTSLELKLRNLEEVYDGNACMDASVERAPNAERFLLKLDSMSFLQALKSEAGFSFAKESVIKALRRFKGVLARVSG